MRIMPHLTKIPQTNRNATSKSWENQRGVHLLEPLDIRVPSITDRRKMRAVTGLRTEHAQSSGSRPMDRDWKKTRLIALWAKTHLYAWSRLRKIQKETRGRPASCLSHVLKLPAWKMLRYMTQEANSRSYLEIVPPLLSLRISKIEVGMMMIWGLGYGGGSDPSLGLLERISSMKRQLASQAEANRNGVLIYFLDNITVQLSRVKKLQSLSGFRMLPERQETHVLLDLQTTWSKPTSLFKIFTLNMGSGSKPDSLPSMPGVYRDAILLWWSSLCANLCQAWMN